MSKVDCIDTISSNVLFEQPLPTWREWLAAGFRLTVRETDRVAVAVFTWSQRSRQRRALEALEDHLLKDIGVSRADADVEAGKPFWRA